MKSIIKTFFILFLAGLLFSAIFYFSSYYPQFVKNKLSDDVFRKIEKHLTDSYLYEKSNLERLNVRFGGKINIKLKRKSIYNPNDTKKLMTTFTDLYLKSVNDLPILFYPLKKMTIRFYISGSEDSGPIYTYADGETKNRYANVREEKLESEMALKARKQKEENEKKLKEKYKRLASKAYGAANFGDLKKEVEQKFEEDPRVRINKVMVANPTYEVIMGSFQYKMTPVYKNGELYLVTFLSKGYWPDEYKKELKTTWKNIVDYYSQIHGKVETELIEPTEIEEDYVEWTTEWQLDKKRIQIGLSRSKGLFYVVIWISHEDYSIN